MIARPTLVPSARPARAIDAYPVVPADADRLPGAAMQAFADGISTALTAALNERGEQLSSVTTERLLRAYAAPRVKPTVKLRRYA